MDVPSITWKFLEEFKQRGNSKSYKTLLSKLQHYGVRGIVNDWFKSFIASRTQSANINESNFNPEKIMYGSPQGSVLGPLLFILFS